MIKIMDRRYLAGLIDGEGCIRCVGDTHIKARLYITNSYKPLIKMLYDEFGGNMREYIDERPCKSGRFRKPVYHWRIDNSKAEKLLHECYPYLIIKKRQAEIIFSMRKNININYRKVPSSELKRRKLLRNKLDKLNEKGISPFEFSYKKTKE